MCLAKILTPWVMAHSRILFPDVNNLFDQVLPCLFREATTCLLLDMTPNLLPKTWCQSLSRTYFIASSYSKLT